MYQDFRIVAIDTNIQTKTILIQCSFDVNPDSVTDATIQVYERSSKNIVEYTASVVGKDITLNLTDWPEPNAEYIIRIQELSTVLGDSLVAGIRRKIVFASSITSKIEITYPAYNEVINDLRAEWIERPLEGQTNTASYYLEVAKENAFYTIVKQTDVVGRTSIDLTDLDEGQYYIRIRAQHDNEYGLWSDVITFIVEDISTPVPGPGTDPDPDEPVFIPEDINIMSQPLNGETPDSFIIEFDCDIDPASISEILVIRRTI